METSRGLQPARLLTGPDGGKTAHYMVRWLSTRGEAGPWSATASATAGAQGEHDPSRKAEIMNLKPLTLNELFNDDGNMLPQCCQRHEPGPHGSLGGQNISVDEHHKILGIVNNAPWRIDDAGKYYCPFCVLAMRD